MNRLYAAKPVKLNGELVPEWAVYRDDCFGVAIQDVRRWLAIPYKLKVFACPSCRARVRALYIHPADPYHWFCSRCVRLRRALRTPTRVREMASHRALLSRELNRVLQDGRDKEVLEAAYRGERLPAGSTEGYRRLPEQALSPEGYRTRQYRAAKRAREALAREVTGEPEPPKRRPGRPRKYKRLGEDAPGE